MQPIGTGEPLEFRGTDRFRIERKLGAGGMGVVYQARDLERNTTVALKTLRQLDANSVYRFKKEFRALADLEHKNLVRLGELFCEGSQWFFTMELVEGQNFLTFVRPGNASLREHGSEASPSADTMQFALRTTFAGDANPHAVELPSYDEARLRAALGQLALGVSALHAAQKIHRDIKPSNVIVTADDRVVLLDFGLVLDALTAHEDSDLRMVGTAAYMAPEQAASRPVGPEADWYSVGVVIYQALTGRPPFLGPPLELLMNKQRFEPAPPRALVPDVPTDLDTLCVELLRTDPRARPPGRQVLLRLGVQDAFDLTAPASVTAATSLTQAPPFLGRSRELQVLCDAFETSRKKECVTLFVHGESGMGKSALVKHFTDALEGDSSGTVTLRGRCYERESVPYKAFDGIVDALGQRLARLDQVDAALLLPKDVAVLARLFPVLRRVPAVARVTQPRLPDPQELRARAFGALRDLLSRLSDRHPLVLHIDDFQWTDLDSLALLGDVLRPPDGPRLLLLATVQEGTLHARGASDPVKAVDGILGDVRHLVLASLPPDEAKALVGEILGPQALRNPAHVEAIAKEAAGHPLFIYELARHLMMSGVPDPAGIRLDEALWHRIRHLEDPARRLLEVLAIAGAPLPHKTAAQACELDPASFSKWLSILRVAHLARNSNAQGEACVEPYHNRVRDAVLANLGPEVSKRHHAQIADALEATTASLQNPLGLIRHLESAGELERAAQHARRAAPLASEALAFDQAAVLYRIALRLGEHTDAEKRVLYALLGEALANAGRSPEAAAMFQQGARGANAAESLDLHRRAAEQLLLSGHLDQGLATMKRVLAAVHLKLPESPRQVLFELLVGRARVRLRGRRYFRRDESQIAATDLTRIDTCWSASVGLATVDFLRGAAFQTRHLLFALEAGEPYRLARALAAEASLCSGSGGKSRKRTARVLAEARALATEIDHPHALAMVGASEAIAANMEGRWTSALETADRADAQFRDRCTGVAWERDTLHVVAVTALAYLGEMSELGRRVPQYQREAQERGDLYGMTYMSTGEALLCWLARDDPKGARREAERATHQYSRQGLLVQAYLDLLAQVRIDLYQGDFSGAWTRTQERWPALSKSLLLHVQLIRIVMYNLRAQAALACAADGKEGPQQKALLGAAQDDAHRLLSEKMPWSRALARLLLAQIAWARGDHRTAVARYADAHRELGETNMALYAAAARYRQGQLLGGDEGQSLKSSAFAWMVHQGIKSPERMTAVCAPFCQADPTR
jgi:serine/threonine protein kinase